MLARWAAKGWVTRIKQGLYIPVPLESITADIPLEDPWVIAEKIYHPCYIGGWSAAEHWGLTEQIFRTVVVFTPKKLKNHRPVIRTSDFLIHTISEQSMFGFKVLWRGQTKVSVSDPSRTILDFLVNPAFGGGIRSVLDMFKNYLKSEYKNISLLVDYAKQLKNGAVFKRLGFLLEQNAPKELEAIEFCKSNLTSGKIKLDPALSADKLITRWRLWLPENWKK
jgi:predicted transcriptional regulator of viral defense system